MRKKRRNFVDERFGETGLTPDHLCCENINNTCHVCVRPFATEKLIYCVQYSNSLLLTIHILIVYTQLYTFQWKVILQKYIGLLRLSEWWCYFIVVGRGISFVLL